MSAAQSAEAAFLTDQQATAQRSLRVALGLGGIAFLVFIPVDQAIAPESMPALLSARFGIIAALGLLALLSPRLREPQQVLRASLAAAWTIGLGVITVSALVGGATSGYHEALLLTFLGFAALPLTWRWQHAAATFGGLVLIYDLVMIQLDLTGPVGVWITVNVVLWLGALVAGVVGWQAAAGRRRAHGGRLELAAAHQRLLALDAAKTTFFNNISHELRTPLTLVLAPLEAQLEAAHAEPGPGGAAAVEQLSLARRSALRLLHLVDDLLMLSRIDGEALRLHRGPVELRALVERLAEEAAPLARRKRIQIETVGPSRLPLVADPDQIERVVLNLLANALRFTPKDGQITLRLTGTAEAAELAVEDTGPGVPEADRERIFNRFEGAGGAPHGAGAGIGLALARELAELHGGQLWAEAAPSNGARLVLRLPIGDPSAPAAPVTAQDGAQGLPEWHEKIRRGDDYRLLQLDDATERRLGRRRGRAGERPTVLVIEDNPDMVRFLSGVLSGEYDVLAAIDGEAGLKLARERSPKLILCDVMMPGLNGYEVLAALRARPETAATPVVLLTALSEAEHRRRAHASGATATLSKPFQVQELLGVVRSQLLHEDAHARQRSAEDAAQLERVVRWLRSKTPVPTTAEERRQLTLLTAAPERQAEPLALAELVRAALEAVGSEAGRVMVAPLGDRRALTDGSVAAAALAELIDNALRASPLGMAIHLTVEDNGQHVILIVRNEGPGVSQADQGRLFSPFYSTTGRDGLGLCLAARAARTQGGAVALRPDERPHGATFTLSLRAAEAPRSGPGGF